MILTHHYRNYLIQQLPNDTFVITLPYRSYPLVGLQLKTLEAATKWVDDDIRDEAEERRRDVAAEKRYSEDEE